MLTEVTLLNVMLEPLHLLLQLNALNVLVDIIVLSNTLLSLRDAHPVLIQLESKSFAWSAPIITNALTETLFSPLTMVTLVPKALELPLDAEQDGNVNKQETKPM